MIEDYVYKELSVEGQNWVKVRKVQNSRSIKYHTIKIFMKIKEY